MGLTEPRQGGCHCGAVRFRVAIPSGTLPHRCNCSYCTMKGNVMFDVPLGALEIERGEEALTLYTFNTGVAKHRFCATCGIHVFHQLRSEPDKYGINAVCLDGFDIYDLPELPVHNGRQHTRDTGRPTELAGILRFEPAAREE